MPYEITCRSSTHECHAAVSQMDNIYGAAFARIADSEVPLTQMGRLSVFLSIMHPASLTPANDGRGSYHTGLDTYFIWQSLDYADWITTDWSRRTEGYARSVKTAILRVAKTRLNNAERKALLDIADRATEEVHNTAPEAIVPLKSVWLVYYPGSTNPGISFDAGPASSLYQPPGVTYVEVPPNEALKTAMSLTPSKPVLPNLPRVYRRDAEGLRFYEVFPYKGQIAEHWGIAGEGGDNRFHDYATPTAAAAIVAKLKKEKYAEGFRPVPPSKHVRLIVEYAVVHNFADDKELHFRHKAEDFFDDVLGRLGLGYCDGGSSGQGTMEICNFVVDFNLAEASIKRELQDTPFVNYSRIYLER